MFVFFLLLFSCIIISDNKIKHCQRSIFSYGRSKIFFFYKENIIMSTTCSYLIYITDATIFSRITYVQTWSSTMGSRYHVKIVAEFRQTVPSRFLGTFASESYVSFGRNGKLAKRERVVRWPALRKERHTPLKRIHFLPQFAAHKHQQFFLCRTAVGR